MGNWCNIIKILKKKKNYRIPVRKKTKSIIGLAGEEEKRKHLVEKKYPMETTAMQNVYV